MSGLFSQHFKHCLNRMALIGMVHIRALPGTPKSKFSVQQLVDVACEEASIYVKHNLDGICIENMFDTPYVRSQNSGPEITSVMTRVASEVRKICPLTIPCGIQILAGLNREAMSVAVAANLQFVRAEGFVFGHVADEGYIEACAGELLRYRRLLNADHIAVLTDIKKKHCAHAITNDVNVVDTAKAAQFFLSDGIIITGKETGDSPDEQEVNLVKANISTIPLIVGSGVTKDNMEQFIRSGVDGSIIGSHFKQNGKWFNDICEQRLAGFMERYHQLANVS